MQLKHTVTTSWPFFSTHSGSIIKTNQDFKHRLRSCPQKTIKGIVRQNIELFPAAEPNGTYKTTAL